MKTHDWTRTVSALLMMAALMLQPAAAVAEDRPADRVAGHKQIVEIAPRSSDEVARHTIRTENAPVLTQAEKLALLQKHV